MLDWKITKEEKVSENYYTVYYATVDESAMGVWVEKCERGIGMGAEIVFNVSISIISDRSPVIGDYVLLQSDYFHGTFDSAVSKAWEGLREVRDNLNIILDKYIPETDKGNQEKGVRK